MQQEEMSFWDHLEELRWTLFRCILALFIFAIAGFSVMPWLFDNVVMAPCSSDFIVYREMCKISSHFSFLPDFCNDDYHVDIVNIKLASQFFTHMTCSFWLALLLTFPYLVWEVWKFVSPALYENEKRNVRWVFLFGTVMFFVISSVADELTAHIGFGVAATSKSKDVAVTSLFELICTVNFPLLV